MDFTFKVSKVFLFTSGRDITLVGQTVNHFSVDFFAYLLLKIYNSNASNINYVHYCHVLWSEIKVNLHYLSFSHGKILSLLLKKSAL